MQDYLPHPSQLHQPFVCHVCHFSALDNSGLLQHLSVSPHCSMSAADGCPSICINDDFNDNAMLDDDSLVGISAHGYKSNASDLVGVSRA